MGNTVIDFCNVVKSYGKTIALDNLSFSVNEGELVAFLGANGSGKTTTIKLLSGILSPDSGDIRVNGFDIKKEPLKVKANIGYISDNPDIFLRLKGIEYLDFVGDVYKIEASAKEAAIRRLAATFDMQEVLSSKILSYSHGMRQKLAVIATLLHNPKVWILDEPMTGLDPKSAYQLKNLMKENASLGNTVFYSTHVLEVAEKLCDRVLVINKGRLIFDGSLEELERNKTGSLEDIFLSLTEEQA